MNAKRLLIAAAMGIVAGPMAATIALASESKRSRWSNPSFRRACGARRFFATPSANRAGHTPPVVLDQWGGRRSMAADGSVRQVLCRDQPAIEASALMDGHQIAYLGTAPERHRVATSRRSHEGSLCRQTTLSILTVAIGKRGDGLRASGRHPCPLAGDHVLAGARLRPLSTKHLLDQTLTYRPDAKDAPHIGQPLCVQILNGPGNGDLSFDNVRLITGPATSPASNRSDRSSLAATGRSARPGSGAWPLPRCLKEAADRNRLTPVHLALPQVAEIPRTVRAEPGRMGDRDQGGPRQRRDGSSGGRAGKAKDRSVLGRRTVPFSLRENRDSFQRIAQPVLRRLIGINNGSRCRTSRCRAWTGPGRPVALGIHRGRQPIGWRRSRTMVRRAEAMEAAVANCATSTPGALHDISSAHDECAARNPPT